MRKIFMIMLIMSLVLAMPMFAMEPTGPPGDAVMSVGSNLYMTITMVPATGVVMNRELSASSQYAVPGSNPGMLAGLMRDLSVLILLTLMATVMVKVKSLSVIDHNSNQFVG